MGGYEAQSGGLMRIRHLGQDDDEFRRGGGGGGRGGGYERIERRGETEWYWFQTKTSTFPMRALIIWYHKTGKQIS